MIVGKAGYAVRETLTNLRRNLLLTTASLLTVAVSLTLVSSAFLFSGGVENATKGWEAGIEFEIFLLPEVNEAQSERVHRQLLDSPDVDTVVFVSQAEQYEWFKVMFADRPEWLENVTVEDMPPSYRVAPAVSDPDVIQALGQRFEVEPGVDQVVWAEDAIRKMKRQANITRQALYGLAGVLLFAASLLILNTIRMAIFARRREIEVMKLVGATNWFIRVPFMIEGLVTGVLGAAVAVGVIALARDPAQNVIRELDLYNYFVITSSQMMTTGIMTLVIGSLIGGVGAGVAVSKFLDV